MKVIAFTCFQNVFLFYFAPMFACMKKSYKNSFLKYCFCLCICFLLYVFACQFITVFHLYSKITQIYTIHNRTHANCNLIVNCMQLDVDQVKIFVIVRQIMVQWVESKGLFYRFYFIV